MPSRIFVRIFESKCRNYFLLSRLLLTRLFRLLQNFDAIPHVNPYEVGFYGGSVALADYCPYIQEFTWRSNNVVVRGSHCMYSENNPSKSNYCNIFEV